ncbi:MAG TPA: PQQ-dependent sugar dehydrogenase [Chitinophagaceae bacterium]|jgi:glucose/arabinose dehydrogenase|nr:PQQ-dependent sugar dehydrogenase [Chitinophagaceae bacterium]
MTRLFPFLLLLLWAAAAGGQSLRLEPQVISLRKGLRFSLKVPAGYRVRVAAEGLKRPRFFTRSPEGRLFLTDLYNRSDNKRGRVLILEDWNEAEQRFGRVTVFLDSLRNPNSVAFYSKNGRHTLFVAETGKLTAYDYEPGSARPSGTGRVIARFPDYGLHYKYGGWHLTRSLAVRGDKLYVSVGSSCNACVETEEVRATILELNPDGSGQKVWARGLRNSVGLKWVGGVLWVTGMGRDGIGPDRPEDLFHPVREGGFYGWPFYYQYRKKVYPDGQFKDSVRASFVVPPPVAPWGFAAHTAPLGFDYLTGFSDSLLNNSFLVALHGSTSVWRERGNAVVQLLPGGAYRPVVSGFLSGRSESTRYGRPCDVLQADKNSFFISDDKNGVVYFVRKENRP